jgi:branched-chain amino acid aminotransferase
LRQIAKTYAYENGLEDCVLLNDQKNLVEATSGTLYLIQGNNILTPNLESGCQDFALRAAFNLWLEKEQEEYRLCEQVINPFELQKSEEIIILSIEKGIQNVSQYRKTTYTKENSGLLFASFMNQLD